MKWFTTLHSLHQHVWHIERISMTTLTFDEGTEKLFQEHGIHWSQLGAKVQCKNVLHGFQILPLKYLSVSNAIWGDTQKHTDLRANLTLFVYHWSTPKEVKKEPVPSSSTCRELLLSHSEIMKQKLTVLVFLTPHSHFASFLYNPLSPIAILFDLKWICKNVICETPRTVKQAGRNYHNEKVMCILKELFFSVLPGNWLSR